MARVRAQAEHIHVGDGETVVVSVSMVPQHPSSSPKQDAGAPEPEYLADGDGRRDAAAFQSADVLSR